MKYVVFFKTKDLSVTIYANNGTDEDIKEFHNRVSNKLKELEKGSNSESASGSSSSTSNSTSESDTVLNSYKFWNNILVYRIQTNITEKEKFVELLKYLSGFYHVYED